MVKENLCTLQEIKKSIPPHCFERSFLRSFFYIIHDLVILLLAGSTYWHLVPSSCPETPLLQLVWCSAQLLWFWVAGSIATGIWVIGHECGHHAFCTSNFVNDTIGFILHSLLLVPFFSWQYTHGRHHKNNNHLLDNETHLPTIKKKFPGYKYAILKYLGEDAFAAIDIFIHLFLGWPTYIIFGMTGCRRTPNGDRVRGSHNHFFPNVNAFHRNFPHWKVFLSSFGVGSVIFGLYVWSLYRGISEVVRYYIGPYIFVNFWLVMYTWLHHTHPEIPHYGDGEWTWLRGAKGTIDRDYGIYDYLHHDIGSTHVCHHIFSKIPHYHASEATFHLRRVLGDEYNFTSLPWWKALFFTAKECGYVEGVEGVQYYQPVVEKEKIQKKK